MNKFILFILVGLGLVISYNKFIKGKRIEDNPLVRNIQINQEKTGNVSLVGTLLQTSNGNFSLTTEEGTVRLKSHILDLEDYVYEQVRLIGAYSGASLYVDRVDLQ